MAKKDLMSDERLAVLTQCVSDGWPLIQITRTHRVSWDTLRKYFPDYRGMDQKEAAKLGNQGRQTSIALRNMNHA